MRMGKMERRDLSKPSLDSRVGESREAGKARLAGQFAASDRFTEAAMSAVAAVLRSK